MTKEEHDLMVARLKAEAILFIELIPEHPAYKAGKLHYPPTGVEEVAILMACFAAIHIDSIERLFLDVLKEEQKKIAEKVLAESKCLSNL